MCPFMVHLNNLPFTTLCSLPESWQGTRLYHPAYGRKIKAYSCGHDLSRRGATGWSVYPITLSLFSVVVPAHVPILPPSLLEDGAPGVQHFSPSLGGHLEIRLVFAQQMVACNLQLRGLPPAHTSQFPRQLSHAFASPCCHCLDIDEIQVYWALCGNC